jgi:hypothetical protein
MAKLVVGAMLLFVAFVIRLGFLGLGVMIMIVPTKGGLPLLNIGGMRGNLRQQQQH